MVKSVLTLLPLAVLVWSGVFISQINNQSTAPANQIGTITFTGTQQAYSYEIESDSVGEVGVRYSQVFTGPVDSVVSDVLPPGAIIYTVPGVDPSKELAVKWHGEYRKVERTN